MKIQHKGGNKFLVDGVLYTSKKGSLRSLCRKLVREGRDRSEVVEFYSFSGVKGFKDRRLISWAEELLQEKDETGFGRVKAYPEAEWAILARQFDQPEGF